MKKIFVLFCIVSLLDMSAQAQVFNTGQTLKKGTFALGVQGLGPVNRTINKPNIYGHAGFGLTSGIDVAATVGVGFNSVHYVGANIEFALLKHMSLAIGVHKSGNAGIDGTFLFDIPIGKKVVIYSGADSDTDFKKVTETDGSKVIEPTFYVWVPVGVEIELKKSIHLLIESSIAVTPDAYHVVGGGLMFYF